MKKQVTVSRAKPEEFARLGQIMAESFRSAFAAFISAQTLDRCAVAENCGALLASLPREMTVAAGRVEEELMGLLVFSRQPNGRTEIEAIHSLPECWGSGLGAAMLEFALAQTDAAGLWAFERNHRARRFYEKHGFAFTGETRISEFDEAIEVRYERILD